MMRTSIFSFVALAATLFTSCQDQDECNGMGLQQPLSISASIGGATRASATPKTAWETGDQLGIFVLTAGGGFASPYHGFAENLNAPFTFTANGWTSAKITLSSREGDVYAYYPYAATSADGSTIPVEAASQTDYLWAKGGQVSVFNTHISLNMQHALSQVVFRMKQTDYTGGEGRLSKLRICNNGSSTALQSSGTLNIATGSITGTSPGGVELTANHLIGPSESLFAITVLPLLSTTGEDVKVVFTIDGKDYEHIFATGTTWSPGYRHIYTFTLKDNHLVIGGEDGQTGGSGGALIEPWTDSDRGIILLIPVV